MSGNINEQFLDTWWTQKLGINYGVQWKHIASAQLLSGTNFPLVDLGAGVGVFLKLLEEKWPSTSLVGVEVSETAITGKYCSCQIIKGDITNWTPQHPVSTVSLIDVIEHFPDPKSLIQHVSLYADFILIACPNFNFIKARWDVMMGNIPFQNKAARGGHLFWCQQDLVENMFKECGLIINSTNHLYPKNNNRMLRNIFSLNSRMLAHEFCYLLEVVR